MPSTYIDMRARQIKTRPLPRAGKFHVHEGFPHYSSKKHGYCMCLQECCQGKGGCICLSCPCRRKGH